MLQVKELYGPLLAVITASKSAFDAMVRQHSPDGTRASFIHAAQSQPDSKEGQTYRCSDGAHNPGIGMKTLYKCAESPNYCDIATLLLCIKSITDVLKVLIIMVGPNAELRWMQRL